MTSDTQSSTAEHRDIAAVKPAGARRHQTRQTSPKRIVRSLRLGGGHRDRFGPARCRRDQPARPPPSRTCRGRRQTNRSPGRAKLNPGHLVHPAGRRGPTIPPVIASIDRRRAPLSVVTFRASMPLYIFPFHITWHRASRCVVPKPWKPNPIQSDDVQKSTSAACLAALLHQVQHRFGIVRLRLWLHAPGQRYGPAGPHQASSGLTLVIPDQIEGSPLVFGTEAPPVREVADQAVHLIGAGYGRLARQPRTESDVEMAMPAYPSASRCPGSSA